MAARVPPRSPEDRMARAGLLLDAMLPTIPPWTIPGEAWGSPGQQERRLKHNRILNELLMSLQAECGAKITHSPQGSRISIGTLAMSSSDGVLAALHAWLNRAKAQAGGAVA